MRDAKPSIECRSFGRGSEESRMPICRADGQVESAGLRASMTTSTTSLLRPVESDTLCP